MQFLAIFSLLALISDQEWQQKLGQKRYEVMRKKRTEQSYSAPLPLKNTGTFLCAACEAPLFRCQDQYEVSNGWPNFTYPISKTAVYYLEDWSVGFKRYEVLCRGCDSHLGHVFPDGPPPKYFRYCINSISLKEKEE